MFAIPLIAPLQQTLSSRMFGRFMPRAAAPAATLQAVAPAMDASADLALDDVPDLAQRVRETGEW